MNREQTRERYVKLLRTIVVSGGALIINAMINFFIVPVVSNTVGTEAYGFVSLAKTFEQYAIIATTALNAFAARYIVISYHENNLERTNVYFSSTFFGDAFCGTVIFILALLFINKLERFLSISQELISDVKLLFVFIFFDFWIVTISTAFNATAYIKNKLDLASIFKMLSYCVEAGILIVFYKLLRPHLWYFGLGRVSQAVIIFVGAIWIWKKYTIKLKIERRYFSWKAIKQLVVNGTWTSFNSVGGVLNDGLDLWICNMMLTPLGMGQLAIAKTFHSFFTGVFGIIGQAFQPLFLKSYAKNDRETLLGEFRLSMKVSGMMSNIMFAGFVALGISFYKLWIPKEDILLIYGLTIVSNMATVPSGPMFPLYFIYVLTEKNRFPTIMTFISGLLNVLSMYILLRTTELGNYAILWTSVVVSALIAFISNPLYMAHVLKEPWWFFYPTIIRNLICCGVVVFAFKIIAYFYTPDSWFSLLISSCLLFVVGIALHLSIMFNRNERKRILSMIKNRKSSI